ncbi:MAG TPA: hypothetical protein VED45_08400 [Steroidobacteraceae bacterium]|nr:hypothetical protein [Steroidobacteraceae bacterium]
MKTLTPWCRSHGASLATILLAAVTAASAQQQGATTQYGELNWGTRQYYPQGCTHSGNTAICTFVFVQQAQTQPIHVGWGGELGGIQFVDDSHVPHNPSNAYFVDNYGARQTNMTVNRGDQGTLMVEFAQVDPQVQSGSFTLQQQVINGIPVGQGGGGQLGGANSLAGMGGAPGGAAAPARPAAPALAAPNTLNASNTHLAAAPANQAAAGQQNCNTPQMANTPACKLNTKINNAQNSAANTVGAVAAPVSAVQQLGNSISSLFKKPAPAPAPAPAAAPAPQPTQQ